MSTALILVVDDDAEVRDIGAAILRAAGYRVLEAANANEALTLLDANPDTKLVFTDVVMPGIDGFKLGEMAKSARPGISVLYTTGYAHFADDTRDVVRSPMLKKPYRPMQLVDVVQKMLA